MKVTRYLHPLCKIYVSLNFDLLLKDVGSSKDACLSKDDLSSKDACLSKDDLSSKDVGSSKDADSSNFDLSTNFEREI